MQSLEYIIHKFYASPLSTSPGIGMEDANHGDIRMLGLYRKLKTV
jgi:hypothetical protein